MDHQGRLGRLRHVMEQRKLDALLITHLPNIRYLCGFTGSSGTVLATYGGVTFFTDGRYAEQVRAEVHGCHVRIVRKSALVAAGEWLADEARLRKIGVEAAHLTIAERTSLAAALGNKSRLIDAPPMIEGLRQIKDADEIDRIRAACHRACAHKRP